MPGTRWDAVVAGAGTGGLVAAERLARQGWRTLVMDKQPADRIGLPWVNAVEKAVFARLGLPVPSGRELVSEPLCCRLAGPTGGEGVVFAGAPVFDVRMSDLQQRLLAAARAAGAVVHDGVRVEGPLVEHGQCVGVVTASGVERARLTIDAAGLRSPLRAVLEHAGFGDTEGFDVPEAHICRAIQGVWAIDEAGAREAIRAGGIADNVQDARVGVEGGYSTLNVRLDLRAKTFSVLLGVMLSRGHQAAKKLLERCLAAHPFAREQIYGGGGDIPVRRAFDNMVAPGYIAVGDAACQVNPQHGSGVASAMEAGALAAEVGGWALAAGSVDMTVLWAYNARWQRGRGATLAGSDVVRRFSEGLSGADAQGLMQSGLISEADVLRALETQPLGGPAAEVPQRLFAALRAPRLAAKFLPVVARALLVQSHYRSYPARPEPRGYMVWQSRVRRLFGLPDTV